MLSLISTILMFISIILIGIETFLNNNLFVFWAFNIMWISNLIYSFARIRKRFIFCVFNATFFLFVMGRVSLSYFFTGDFSLNYSNLIINKVFYIIMSALFFIRIFYMIFEKKICIRKSICKKKITKTKIDIQLLKKASMYIYWFSYIFTIIYVIERVLFVEATSYANYYVNFYTKLPSIFAKMYSLNEISFFVYLATNPSKREFKMPAMSFILIGLLSLGYGQRNPIALRVCILLMIYVPLREYFRKDEEEQWITKKYRLFIIAMIPTLIVFFAFWGMHRINSVENMTIGNLILDFFDSQGNSIRILAETIEHIDEFPTDRVYTLGPLTEFVKNNFLYKAIFGRGIYYETFTIEGALQGWNFGNIISYLYSPFHYFNGVGLGSSYLAEVFKDFGYMGIIGISVLYSWIIAVIMKIYNRNVYLSGIILIFIYEIIYSPRDCALSFLAKIFSFTFILALVMIFGLYIILKKYKKRFRKLN